MKECKYCRTQYADNLSVCPNCGGTKFFSNSELAEEADFEKRKAEYKNKAKAEQRKYKSMIIGALSAVAVVVVAIVAIVLINANKPLSNGMTREEGKAVLAEGIDHLENREYEAAMDCFQQLPPDSKQYSEAQELLLQSQNAYREEIINRVNTHIDNKEFEVALDLVSNAQGILPDDPDLKQSYDNAYSAYISSLIEKVNSYVSNGEYEVAIEFLNSAKTKYPNDATIQDTYSSTVVEYHTIVRTEACKKAEDFITEGDYVNAIKTVNEALIKIGSDDELNAKLTTYANEYVPTVISAAENQYVRYNAESIYAAEKIISDAISILPNNQALISELNRYKDLEPIRIAVMSSADQGNGGTFATKDTATDAYGNKYNDIVYVDRFEYDAHDDNHDWWWYCYKTINIDYKYSKITGVLFQNSEYASASTKTRVVVEGYTSGYDYLGGDVLWQGQVSGQTEPLQINADVSGMQYIKINFQGDHGAGNGDDAYHYAYIAELYLWK